MKTFKTLFGMTVLAMMAASCSNDLADVQAPEQAEEVGGIHFTATIAPKNFDATTRALVDNEDGTLSSNWVVDDVIVMYYNIKQGDTTKPMFAKAVVKEVNTTTGAATIDAVLAEGVTDGTEVSMSYPEEYYTMAMGEEQDGSLSGKMDARRGKGTIKVDGSEATLASGAKLDAVYAIVKFTTKDMDGNLLEISRLDIGDSEGEAFITILTNDSEIYAALPPTNEYTQTLWFDARDYDAWPCITKGTANLEAGKFYEIDLKLAQVGDVILSNGSFAAPGTEDAVAMIAYLDADPETTTHGLAIALEDVVRPGVSWDDSWINNDGKTAAELLAAWGDDHSVGFGTWRMGSFSDWQNMFIGCGSSSTYTTEVGPKTAFDPGDILSMLTAAGEKETATPMAGHMMWTSEEYDSTNAYSYNFGSYENWFNYCTKTSSLQLRGVLAF